MEPTLSTADNATPSDQDEFAAAFAEIGQAAQAEQAAAAAEANPTAAAPAPQDGEAEPPAPGDKEPTAASAPAPADDPAAKLAELQRQLAEAQHRERSASNRISTFQRNLNEAQRRIDELTQAQQSAAKPADSKPAGQASPTATGIDDPELASVLQEMPELGAVIDKLVARRVAEQVGTVETKLQQVQQSVEPLRARAEQDRTAAELAEVERQFPNWRETVFSPEFEAWIESRPTVIRDAWGRVQSAAEGSEFLRMYHLDKGLPLPAAGASNTPNTPNPAATPSGKQQRLAKAVGIPSRNAAAPLTGMPAADDFEGAFNFFARQQQAA